MIEIVESEKCLDRLNGFWLLLVLDGFNLGGIYRYTIGTDDEAKVLGLCDVELTLSDVSL